MSPEIIILIIGTTIVAITFVVVLLRFVLRRAPLKPRKKVYQTKWSELQLFCKQKETWPKAVLAADELVDRALIKKGFKGKSTGERMVSAQREFTDNDSLWLAHKLAKKLQETDLVKLKEAEVKGALIGFRQALKDLGAI